MKKNIYEIASLVKKSLIEDLNEEEAHKLQQLLQDKSLKEIYDQIYNPQYLQEQLNQYSNYSSKEAYQRFLQEIGSKRLKNRKRSFIYTLSAVAVVITLVISVVFYDKTSPFIEPDIENIEIAEVEIPAGGKKAQLILADGSVVNVDNDDLSVENEDGVNIKYNNGKVSYELANKPADLIYNQLIVPRGGETHIVLEDGTKVWMNADSRLKYPIAFVGDERKVFLEGEAYFEVAENKKKKFIVNTIHGDIHVLGTAFGVNAYPSEPVSHTTLVKGKISFNTEHSPAIDINPGEQILVTNGGTIHKRQVNVEEYVGWKDGIYSFRKKTLKDIMKTFELWYDINVEYDDTAIEAIIFTGHLKRYDNINIFLKALSRTGDVRYKTNGKTITLYK